MKTRILLFFLLFMSAGLSFGLEDSFLNSTVLIRYAVDATHESRGSGFIILHRLAYDQVKDRSTYKFFLVTNKHVLPPEHGYSKEITIRMAVRDGKGEVSASDIRVTVLGDDGKYLDIVALHPASEVDIAAIVLPMERLIEQRTSFVYMLSEKHHALTTDLLVGKSGMKEWNVEIGSEIYLLGYPSAIYDARNVSPLLRVGTIATEPDKSFTFNEELLATYGCNSSHSPSMRPGECLPKTLKGFLVDANVFPGSSGSVVIRKANVVPGISLGGKYGAPAILGIVSGSIPIQEPWGVQRMSLGVCRE